MSYAALQKAGWHNASKQLSKALLSSVQGVSAEMFSEYTKCADKIIDRIETGASYPIYTGNLHDSIGAVVYKGSTIYHFSRMKDLLAFKQKKDNKNKKIPIYQHSSTRKRISGINELIKMVNANRPTRNRGLTISVFVAVPYAVGVNKNWITRKFYRFGIKDSEHTYERRSYNIHGGYLERIEKIFDAELRNCESQINQILKRKSVSVKYD